jgi:hypothetical protein
MRPSFYLVQYIFLFRGWGHNLEDTAKVGGHEDIFSSCSIYFPVQRLWSGLEYAAKVGGQEGIFHLVQCIFQFRDCSQDWSMQPRLEVKRAFFILFNIFPGQRAVVTI